MWLEGDPRFGFDGPRFDLPRFGFDVLLLLLLLLSLLLEADLDDPRFDPRFVDPRFKNYVPVLVHLNVKMKNMCQIYFVNDLNNYQQFASTT